MWTWQDHRRKKILENPFPPEWESILLRNVKHFRRLSEEKRKHLRELVQVFVAEKNWEGCGGLAMNDEIRITIAAQACLLVLELPHDLYSGVDSIFVYPTTVIIPERPIGVFERPGTIRQGSTPILGEAHLRGPVILVWDSVLQMARHPESGHNVVYHEFAHKLDMADGRIDGTPPLENKEQYEQWTKICSKEFLQLRARSSGGRPTFLDSYGAVNEAEFFAVITEQFFDQPEALKRYHPELYAVLRAFYRQDPVKLF